MDQMKEANFLAHHFDRFFLVPNTNAAEHILVRMKAKATAIMIEQRRTKNE
jgi:hypothetical protein